MNLDEIRKKITTLKIHLDQVDSWVRQTADMIYELEENIFDHEDREASIIYLKKDNIHFLNQLCATSKGAFYE